MMNGIEAILAQIRAEAEAQAGQLTAEAEQQAAGLLEEGARKAEAERAAVAAAGQARAAAALEKARQDAVIEGRRQTAAEKQKLIDRAFAEALERLLKLPEEEYAALLAGLAVSACEDGTGGELLLSEKDRARVGAQVLAQAQKALPGAKLTLAEDCARIRGGVVVRRGAVELNCALETLVRMQAEQCAGQVARTLFREGA